MSTRIAQVILRLAALQMEQAVAEAMKTLKYPEDIRDEALRLMDADPEDWDLRADTEREIERQRATQTAKPVNYSTNGNVIEYAARIMAKGKNPKAAAEAAAAFFHGSENMFIGPGVIEIDPKALEQALWGRLVDRVVASMKSYKEGKESLALEGTLLDYKQEKPGKPNAKMRAELRKRVADKLGHDPF